MVEIGCSKRPLAVKKSRNQETRVWEDHLAQTSHCLSAFLFPNEILIILVLISHILFHQKDERLAVASFCKMRISCILASSLVM